MLFSIINHLMRSKIMKYLMINLLMTRSKGRRKSRRTMKKTTKITMIMTTMTMNKKRTNMMTKKLKFINDQTIKIDIIHLFCKLMMTKSNLNNMSISIPTTTTTIIIT